MSVCLPVYRSAWENLAPAGWIFVKCHIEAFMLKSVKKIQVLLKPYKDNRHFS